MATYRLVKLGGLEVTNVDLNERNHVAFSAMLKGASRGYYYDGSGIRPLGSLGGRNLYTTALNDIGQVVGYANFGPDELRYHVFQWSVERGIEDLGTSPGAVSSMAEDINNRGEIVGRAIFGNPGDPQPFYWSPGTGFTQLGLVDGFPGNAWEINDAGQVRGAATSLSAEFRWSKDTGMLIQGPPDGTSILGIDMNAQGQIAGGVSYAQSFLWTPGKEFLVIDGAVNPSALNDRESIVGSMQVEEFSQAYVWTRATGIVMIGALGGNSSFGFDINNHGQAVGLATLAGDLEPRAFVWTRDGGMVDLNTRVRNAPPGLVLFMADEINDSGAITASAYANGRYLLLTGPGAHEPPLTAPIGVSGTARAGSPLTFKVAYTDVDTSETHRATWTWGDGRLEAGTVRGRDGVGTVGGRHVYRRAGIYTVTLRLTDSGGLTTKETRTVVVSDADAQVRGEGFFRSPAGALEAAQGYPDIGSFAFLSTGGAAHPQEARVEVTVGAFQLRSTRVEQPSVSERAVRYRGHGTANGRPGYQFDFSLQRAATTVTADRVRLRVWHRDARTGKEVVDYDNTASGGSVLGATSSALEPSVIGSSR